MLKDCNNDPLLAGVNEENDPVRNSIFGQVDFQNSPSHAGSINKLTGIATSTKDQTGINSPGSRSTRSGHKIVTPLRQQNTSSLIASLESFSSNSQGVSEQIAKITSTFVSPASNLANSFASLTTLDTLCDPNLLQSHVQKSLDTFGLESPYNVSSSVQRSNTTNNTIMTNSLYNTPLRCKQSKSHDFSELPSQQRLRRRRSSILGQEDENKLFEGNLGEVPLSDLSHFQADDDEINCSVIPTELDIKENKMINSNESGDNFNYFDDSESEDFIEQEISPMKLSTKRPRTIESRAFTLPSTAEYQDGSKPPYSYASLIAQAIISSPKQRLALSNIYCWIMETYPYYKAQSCGWQVNKQLL